MLLKTKGKFFEGGKSSRNVYENKGHLRISRNVIENTDSSPGINDVERAKIGEKHTFFDRKRAIRG
jgi:hypothetical protein